MASIQINIMASKTAFGRTVKPVKDPYLGNPKTARAIQRLLRKDETKDLLKEYNAWCKVIAESPEHASIYCPTLSAKDSYDTIKAERDRIGRALGMDVDAAPEDASDDDSVSDKTYKPKKKHESDSEEDDSDTDSDEDDEDDDEEDEEDEDEDEEDEDEDEEDEEDEDVSPMAAVFRAYRAHLAWLMV